MTEEKQKVTDDDLVRVKGRLDPFSFNLLENSLHLKKLKGINKK